MLQSCQSGAGFRKANSQERPGHIQQQAKSKIRPENGQAHPQQYAANALIAACPGSHVRPQNWK
jgi:hypothetical protein